MRIKLKELTLRRVFEAVVRRVTDVRPLLEWRFGRFSRDNKVKLSRFRGKHKGQRCFIVANGPSLKDMDLSVLDGEFTIGMNRIYMAFNELGFTADYLVCINELVLQQFRDDFYSLGVPAFLNWSLSDKNLAGDNVSFLKVRNGLIDRFNPDLTTPVSSGGTVTFVSLQLAYYLGFEEVIIIGMDHSFHDSGLPNKTETRATNEDLNHFHPDYFPKGMKWQLPDLYRSEKSYELARDFCAKKGVSIFDATAGGKCNVFEKREFNSFFSS